MIINIIKDSVSDSEQPKVYDLGQITTTLQDLLNESNITITDERLIVLKIQNIDDSFNFYLLPIDYKGNSVYGLGNNVVVSDLISLSSSNSVGGSQTLAETLAEDNKTNDIPIVSNNGKAVVTVNDDYLYISYEGNYLSLEPTNGLQLFSDTNVFTIAPIMGAVIDGEISYTCYSFLLNSEEVATQPWVTSQGYGTINITNDFADDAAAAIGGIQVGKLYHTAGIVKVRLV